ncbi:MAG: serine hydroxymethyltransferase [Candidatus Saccharibacteria bacterium]|nr:serine hydroxymethyltransferase [Candidatus Saccharibacteria bacterium]
MKDLVFTLIDNEKKRQTEGLELIPSENYVSADVLEAMGSCLTNKYSEGYPHFDGTGTGRGNDDAFKEWPEAEIAAQILPNYRYYGGQANIDRIERLCIDRACRLFNADHANVQPHSGANANEAVYFAWCEPGDKILAMSLPAGGHLTHGSPVTRSAKIYNFISYGVTEDGDIDYAELEKKALAEKPKIILIGYSAFMKIPDFARVKKIAEKIPNCLLMADMAHVSGLIAGGVHPNPLDFGFHVMTTTTHKTLRGPRGGLILSKGNVSSPLKKPEKTLENIPILIDRAVFPGTQGGPLEHVIAAKAVAFGEDLQPEFKDYAKQIVKNAKTLADELKKNGFILQGNGTENHLILVNVKESFGFDGKIYEKALDEVGLTLNANSLPTDKGGAFRPSGVRLGTPAITTRGFKEAEMITLAKWMREVADICIEAGSEENLANYASKLEKIRSEVRETALKFPVPGIN